MHEKLFHQESLSGKTFLVTGGAGFIGSNLVEYLLKHSASKVRVIDNLLTGNKENIRQFLNHPDFEFMEADIRDKESCRKACAGMQYVSHQAALGSVPRSVKDPLTTHEINSTGFLNMLVAAREEKVKRLVYASSSSVYGDHPQLPKKEEDTGNPLSPYAVTKKTNELYASVFSATYQMEIIGLRYFNVFGPNQSPEGPYAAVIPLFIENIMNNQHATIDGDGEQTRDFTYVDNAIQANIKGLLTSNREALNKVYNVAVGERISINQLFESIAALAGSNAKPVYRESRAGDIRDSIADISRSKKLLGYEPTIRFKSGLELTLNWFMQNLKR